VASAHFGSLIGESHLLCADVGGTSCDISVVSGGEPFVNTTFELEHDLVVNALANEVTAIGAGGGSLVTIGQAGEIQVGPGSAGSNPGPACYGRGGTQPTTTDTCVMIGILDPGTFAGGQLKLDAALARQAFEGLESDFTLPQRVRYAYEMAVHNIAEGVFNVAIKNGIDPRDYTLVAYGAAGPMLLPAAMDAVHCKQVIVPPNPGLFSALGLLSANQAFTANSSVYAVLSPEVAPRIDALFNDLEAQLRAGVEPGTAVTFERSFDAHLVGQSWETPFVPVPEGPIDADAIVAMIASFHETYEQRSGNRFDMVPVEGVTYRVRAVLDTEKVQYPEVPKRGADDPLTPAGTAILRYLGGSDAEDEGEHQAVVYERASLRAGDELAGPAIINEGLSTTHVGAGQQLSVGRYGELVITRK
jgi:N-methylhydantoinase A